MGPSYFDVLGLLACLANLAVAAPPAVYAPAQSSALPAAAGYDLLRQTEAEAAAIIKQAEQEAEAIAREAHDRVADFVRRRTKQAEDKIAAAETAATTQVRAAAADAATKAAEIVLKVQTKAGLGEKLIAEGIADLKQLLH